MSWSGSETVRLFRGEEVAFIMHYADELSRQGSLHCSETPLARAFKEEALSPVAGVLL